MSSYSNSEQYTSSEEEFIRTKNYKTRSGRTSRTRYRRAFTDSDSDSNNSESSSSSNSTSTSDSEKMAALNLTAEQLSNLLKTSNAANSSDKLPSFRGRARECDPMFDETTSFSSHITLLRSHIAAIPNLSEYDKKQLLVRSADPKVGDFRLTVSALVQGDYYRDATFDEIVNVLDNIYVEKKTSSVQSITRDLRQSRLFETASIGTQLVETFEKVSKVTNHLVGPDGMNFDSQFPVIQPNETQNEFEARVINFLKVVLNDVLIFGIIGPQLSDELHKKVFSGGFKPPETVLTELTKNIRELSSGKAVLCNVRKQSVPVCLAEEAAFESDDYAGEHDSSETVETYFARAGSRPSRTNGTFGRGRAVVQRGRIFRGRGERTTTTNFESGEMNFGRGTSRGKSRGRGYEMEGRRSTTSNSVVCHNCDKDGHLAHNCSKSKIKCFKCNELGHLAKYCRALKGLRCSRCGQENHTSKSCTASVEEMNEWRKDAKNVKNF